VGFGFVDDVNLVIADNQKQSTSLDVTHSLQKTLDLWETGLQTSRGALSAAKSHWTLIDFGWKNGVWSYLPINKLDGQLLMNNVLGNRKLLDRLESWEAEWALGIRLAPSGNTQTEFQYQLQQANTWASQMSCHKIS